MTVKMNNQSSIVKEMVNYLDACWNSSTVHDEHKWKVSDVIQCYFTNNVLAADKPLDRQDYLFILEDLKKAGVFQSLNPELAAYHLCRSHTLALEKV